MYSQQYLVFYIIKNENRSFIYCQILFSTRSISFKILYCEYCLTRTYFGVRYSGILLYLSYFGVRYSGILFVLEVFSDPVLHVL